MTQVDNASGIIDFELEDGTTFCKSNVDVSTWTLASLLSGIKEEQQLDSDITLDSYELRCRLNKGIDNNKTLLLNEFKSSKTLNEIFNKKSKKYNVSKIYLYKKFKIEIKTVTGSDDNNNNNSDNSNNSNNDNNSNDSDSDIDNFVDWGSDNSDDDNDDDTKTDDSDNDDNDSFAKSKNKKQSSVIILNVSNVWSIDDIKKEIDEREGIPKEIINLQYNNNEIENDKITLKDLNLDMKNTIQFIVKIASRGNDAASEANNRNNTSNDPQGPIRQAPDVEVHYEDRTGKNGYHFYYVKPGLNYGGRCKNKECIAGSKNERVCMHRGLGTITPLDDAGLEEIVCPGCEEPFHCREYAIFQCECEIKWKRAGDKVQKKKKIIKGHTVWRLGQKKNKFGLTKDADYEALKIICKPLEKK